MSKKKQHKFIFLGAGILILIVCIAYIFWPGLSVQELSIIYPYDNTLFPPDIASPTFKWDDKTSAGNWVLRFEFSDRGEPLEFQTTITEWKPEREIWESIKKKSLEKPVNVTIQGCVKRIVQNKIHSRSRFTFTTSKDSVGAPIFFRAVTLPFLFAVHHMETIKWCLGDISSEKPPRIVLEDMPVCANCHSFTQDGRTLAMDVDYANDKGSYVITDISDQIILSNEKVITWSEYRREDRKPTFGLLSQISPDGRYAISTVKDRSVFVPKDDLYYSQLFFPFRGILAYYDREKKSFHALPGADDPVYVQSNPSWSPDGETILFAKTVADTLMKIGDKVLLTQEQCKEFLKGQREFKFDLYKIPFNNGKGGVAEPIPGASNNGMSNYFARYSPDGKWIVFCKANNFMLLQPDSKLYIMPAEGAIPRLMNCNTNQMNSWHSWSPNSKWLVFTSKVFSHYTHLCLTHIDENGNDSPPVLLSNFIMPERAVNIPEFVNINPDRLQKMEEAFIDYYSYKRMAYEKIGVDNEEAERLLKHSIKLNPSYASTHNLLGSLLGTLKRFDEAEKEYKIAADLAPNDPAYHNNLGALYMEKKQYDKAQKAFETALKYDSRSAPAYEGLGEILLNRGEIDTAQAYFEKSIKFDPSYPFSYKKLGMVLSLKGEIDRAKSIFEMAIKLDPNDAVTHNLLGTVYMDRKEHAKARKAFEIATQLNPAYALPHEGLGEYYLASGDTVQAQQHFEKSIELDPNYPFAYKELGNILLSKDKIDSAKMLFERGIKLNPKDPDNHNNLGIIHLDRKEYNKAQVAFESAIKYDPKYARAYEGLGEVLLAKGNIGDAQKCFEIAIGLAPDLGESHYRLGTIFINTKEFEKARKEFETALRINPDDLKSLHGLGIYYMTNKEYNKAEKAFRRVYQADPDNPNVCLMLGKVYSMNGRTVQEAISMYKKSLSIKPTTQGHVELGNLYLKKGDKPKAIAEFEKALKLNPDAKDLKAYIEKIKQKR